MLIARNADFEALLRRCASDDQGVSMAARQEFAMAVQATIRQGLLVGDVAKEVFNQVPLGEDEYLEFTLDMLQPGEEDEFVAYTIPDTGKIPQRNVEADYVRIPYYRVGNSIDWDIRFSKKGRGFQIGRINEIYQAGFTKKLNDDGWQTLIAAAADRNILIYDADAAAGQFTKRVLGLAKLAMRRNGGGNSATIKRSELTDVFCSPEAEEDVRSWGIDQISEQVRTNIYYAQDGSSELLSIQGVKLHTLDEFGEGQIYQDFYINGLGASLQASDVELAIGLDLKNRDAFWMPMKEDIQVFDDMTKHREQKQGIYGWGSFGFGVTDSRRAIALSF